MPALSNAEMPDQPPRKPSRRARPEPRRRGGRRPGAPKGNLNSLPVLWPALKDGANSQQLQDLAEAIAIVPDARKTLARLVRRQRRRQSYARTVAIKLLPNLLRTCFQALQAGDDHPYSDTVTIVSSTDPPARRGRKRDVNQSPQSNRPSQSNPPVGQGPSPAAS